MSDVKEFIQKLKNDANNKSEEVDRLQIMLEKYPDLKQQTGRWDKVAYCSPSVNGQVTDFDWRYNCGCCWDTPVEVWPYLQTELGKIYSLPATFIVGNKYHKGRVAKKGWKEDLQKAGIADKIIERISHLITEDDDYDPNDLFAPYLDMFS